jgi:Ca-activated chloride channel family protein
MRVMVAVRRISAVVAASSLCAQAPVMAEQGPRLASNAIIDGAPTPNSCARYGFGVSAESNPVNLQRRRSPHGRSPASPQAPVLAPPPPMPGPPPPAAPADELAVTGYRLPTPQQTGLTAPTRVEAMLGNLPQSFATGGKVHGPPGPPAGAVETERYPTAKTNSVKRVAEDPVSTFSIDVDTASYANARRFLKDGQLPPRDAVRVEEMVNYFDYNYPRPASPDQPFRALTAVAPSPWTPGKQIIHIGLQGYDLARAEQPPLNLVFLVDVSGSMNEPDKLPLAVQSLNLLIDQLRPRDTVSLAVYAGAAGAVLPPTPGTQKLKMRCALQALSAGGSTAGGEGLALAYSLAKEHFRKGAVNRVIMMTDGDFNVGVADPSKLTDFVAEKRKTGVYLSVFGFGRGNYNDQMMQSLAQNGNGTAAYIDEVEEARKLFRTDFTASLFPIADDVKIQVEFNPARVSEYRLIGYETRLLNREDFNNDRVDAGEVGAGASVTAIYEITPAGGPLSVDQLRYGPKAAAPQGDGKGRELAFLRVRYKAPGGSASRLMEQPIGDAQMVNGVGAAPEATRFALAVAGFAQRLRGDPWVGERFDAAEITRIADSARAYDPDGSRAEFVQLVRASGGARSVNE